MESTTALHAQAVAGAPEDDHYDAFLHELQRQFIENLQAGDSLLFTTDAEGLFDAYLAAIPERHRQYYTCSCCRTFVQRFGGLVTINESGAKRPALWDDNSPHIHRAGITAMARMVRRAKVTGVFLSTEAMWGYPEAGGWKHMHIALPAPLKLRGTPGQTAGQIMAEKREDFKNMQRALAEFTPAHVEQALNLLRTDSLYRSEKVIGPAEFLRKLHADRAAAPAGQYRDNILWRAVAAAPAGFCHPRSSMIGTLLEDIASGMSFDEVARRFADKMHPLQYQRPQAAPTAGNVARAEKLVADMGIESALRRRYARLEDIQKLWSPPAAQKTAQPPGVFSHVTLKEAAGIVHKGLSAPVQDITWEKFRRTVLPGARKIEFVVPTGRINFCGLVTASDPDAKPILQWDTEESRNPVSWYVYNGGSSAADWGLRAGELAPVTAITLQPSMWAAEDKFQHQGKSVIFVLEAARDRRDATLCLFPEILKAELREVRATIEAFSRTRTLEGGEEASANGVRIGDRGNVHAHVFRVTSDVGVADYLIDRWD
ncbi:hypothetical protein SAMD00023378_3944 [Ralstonia sp. NT80]|uniref:hypothetical protein n=1 Tax=Ralstonia sp. NT80 TaxID=1218247 RepID=UPI00073F7EA4|nr:hypothetical protein [Ralstonia sp. NT80]GAQ30261.1 hypothetical protein SAMD00023378_3944 [Ralstonia sp. NT80]